MTLWLPTAAPETLLSQECSSTSASALQQDRAIYLEMGAAALLNVNFKNRETNLISVQNCAEFHAAWGPNTFILSLN